MSIPVPDLGAMHRVYSEQGREPEVTARIPKPRKGQPDVPDIGDTVTIATPTNGYALVVRPKWDTMRHPWQDEQDRLDAAGEAA